MLYLWAQSHRGRLSVCAAPERILGGIKRYKCLLAWLSYAPGSMSAGREHLHAQLGATLLGENDVRAGVLHLPRPHLKRNCVRYG